MKLGLVNFFKDNDNPHIKALVKRVIRSELAFGLTFMSRIVENDKRYVFIFDLLTTSKGVIFDGCFLFDVES
jgi:hypothetical protein